MTPLHVEKTKEKDVLTLVFVWSHSNALPYNTDKYPFLHNIQYHGAHCGYKCIVLYDVTTELLEPSSFMAIDNVQWVPFKCVYPEQYRHYTRNMLKRACKIDYMKMCVVLMPQLLNACTDTLLLMDMDCVVKKVNWQRFASSQYCLEPFFDATVNCLIKSLYNIQNEYFSFDSYLENYAVLVHTNLIMTDQRCKTLFDKYRHRLTQATFRGVTNCDVYKFYINFIVELYSVCYNYQMPQKYVDLELQLTPSVEVSFKRGNSWSEINRSTVKMYDYVYDYRQKPQFREESLCSELYRLILSGKVSQIHDMLRRLKKLNYNFANRFEWSNTLQCYVNVYGVICDRLNNGDDKFDITPHPYLPPLYKFDK